MGRTAKPAEALTRGGRYQTLDNGLKFKEIVVGGDSEAGRRFVVVLNPTEAERDRKKRVDIVTETTRRLDALKQLEGEPHEKAACALRSHSVFGRYIHQTKTGRLRLDREKIKAEERLDGKSLVSTSDDGLSARDVVLGYKPVSYTHLRAHETVLDLVCRLLLEKKNNTHTSITNRSSTT
mgnify:CR=1 FL=1